jgi:CDP-glycerol glycerophosphotransferase (TagB/SpsB family)
MHQYKRQLGAIDAALSALRAIFLRLPLSALNWIVQKLVKTDAARWVFLNQNTEFTGNLYYFFEYVRSHRPDVKAHLIVFDPALARALQHTYGVENVSRPMSWKAVSTFLSSGVAIIAYGMVVNAFFPYVLLPGQKFVVNLWHGVPLKRIGYQARMSFERQRRFERQRYSRMIASSKFEQLAYACSFNMNIDDVWITGVPRNDVFRAPKKDLDSAGGSLAAPLNPGSKIILYAPTWRDSASNTQIFPFPEADLQALEEWLETENAYLLVRFHYIERNLEFPDYRRILHDDGKIYGEVQRMMQVTDVLVTDYSSIYFDFLLLDRPVIFIPYDAVQYEKTRGFMLPYEWATPGPKVASWADFMGALKEAIENPQAHAARRQEVRSYTHAFEDGGASERISRAISLATRA